MIIGTIAPAVHRFYHRFLKGADGVGVWAGIVLPILLHGLLLAVKRRTLHALGEATLVHWVCAGTVCRWLARVRFPVDRWYEHCFRQMLKVAARLGVEDDWVVIFDGTDTKRGGLAKIQNMRRYKKEKKSKKGRASTKTHTFLAHVYRAFDLGNFAVNTALYTLKESGGTASVSCPGHGAR